MYDGQENACVSSPEGSNGNGLQVGRHQLKAQAKSALRVPHLPCPAGFVVNDYYYYLLINEIRETRGVGDERKIK